MKHRRRLNWRVSDVVRRLLKSWLEVSARLRGQAFYCSALHGQSEYNLTINSDLTVSCNCQDYNGSGHIGDLNRNSFEEVFYGPVAEDFRQTLARGKLPITTCTRCGDLKRIAKSKIPQEFFAGTHGAGAMASARAAQPPGAPPDNGSELPPVRLPYRGMLLENTVRCNIDCIGCDRQSAARIRSQKQMDLDKLPRMADLIRNLGLQQLFFLNLGEPFLSPNIGEELRILRQKNPDCRIVISTNGIVLNSDAKREAAMHASHVFFSIAGVDDAMLKKYEHFGSFEKAFGNMKALVEYRNAHGRSKPLVEWKYLLFNWNDRRRTVERAIELAKEARLDAISFWPTCNPFFGMSWRYRLGMLNDVGVTSWKGREVILRPGPPSVAAISPVPLSIG